MRHSWSAAHRRALPRDRKSTRLNSSHLGISYAVFCLKKNRLACRSTTDSCVGASPQIVVLDTSQSVPQSPKMFRAGSLFFFFLNDGAPPEISTFSHPAVLPI